MQVINSQNFWLGLTYFFCVIFYTHATPKCNISKANCADICGLKLQGSYYRLIFYNNANWGKEPCPSRPDSVFICKEAAKAFHSMRTSPLHMLRLIIDHRDRGWHCIFSLDGYMIGRRPKLAVRCASNHKLMLHLTLIRVFAFLQLRRAI